MQLSIFCPRSIQLLYVIPTLASCWKLLNFARKKFPNRVVLKSSLQICMALHMSSSIVIRLWDTVIHACAIHNISGCLKCFRVGISLSLARLFDKCFFQTFTSSPSSSLYNYWTNFGSILIFTFISSILLPSILITPLFSVFFNFVLVTLFILIIHYIVANFLSFYVNIVDFCLSFIFYTVNRFDFQFFPLSFPLPVIFIIHSCFKSSPPSLSLHF